MPPWQLHIASARKRSAVRQLLCWCCAAGVLAPPAEARGKAGARLVELQVTAAPEKPLKRRTTALMPPRSVLDGAAVPGALLVAGSPWSAPVAGSPGSWAPPRSCLPTCHQNTNTRPAQATLRQNPAPMKAIDLAVTAPLTAPAPPAVATGSTEPRLAPRACQFWHRLRPKI